MKLRPNLVIQDSPGEFNISPGYVISSAEPNSGARYFLRIAFDYDAFWDVVEALADLTGSPVQFFIWTSRRDPVRSPYVPWKDLLPELRKRHDLLVENAHTWWGFGYANDEGVEEVSTSPSAMPRHL